MAAVKVVVLCHNAAGEPEFHCVATAVTEEQVREGEHYELAKTDARDNGFEGPMIAFDGQDVAAGQFKALSAWFERY